MTRKEAFVRDVIALMQDAPEKFLSPEGLDYWNGLQMSGKATVKFTENGKIVLDFIRKNKAQCKNLFKAKDIGEQIGLTSRTVSGAMRKLVNDGYVEKLGETPAIYALTQLGEDTDPYACV